MSRILDEIAWMMFVPVWYAVAIGLLLLVLGSSFLLLIVRAIHIIVRDVEHVMNIVVIGLCALARWWMINRGVEHGQEDEAE